MLHLRHIFKPQNVVCNIFSELTLKAFPLFFSETSHIFKPLLNAVLYFRNLKDNSTFLHKVWFSVFYFRANLVCRQRLVCHAKFGFPQCIFNTKFFWQSSVQISLITQKFSASFFKNIKRKNRSEAFSVSSENILHLTFRGLKMWRKCNTKPSQI